ncbi:hypothetical protein D3C85_1380020 [compost metagenome]
MPQLAASSLEPVSMALGKVEELILPRPWVDERSTSISFWQSAGWMLNKQMAPQMPTLR